MRIALVSEHASPLAALGGADAGGQNVHVAALAAGLARRGHDVVVHTRRDDPGLPDLVRTDDGYTVDHVPAGPAAPIPKDDIVEHLDPLAAGLAGRWSADPVDLVHAHFWMSGVAATRAVRALDRPPPVLQTFHALGVVKRRHQGAADTSPPGRIDAERALLRDVDHVLATCTDEVRELRALGMRPGRASVIPCGVDTDLFRPGAPGWSPRRTRQHRLLCVGRLVPRKGVDTVIAALARIHGAELLVVGGPAREDLAVDPEVRRLRRAARDAGVADRVRFLGGVPSDAVPPLMADSDLVLTGAWYEPFGITPVEAMSCGVPVVATDVGGHRDTVVAGSTGERVPPRDPATMAVAVQRLLDDPGLREAYAWEGRRRARELYDWRRIIQRTEVVYQAAAGTAAVRGQQEVRS